MPTPRRLLLAGLAVPAVARAQPARRPLRLVVPFPPGGATDSAARLLAERLAPILDVAVVVDNRAGAGGLIGADAVAKGPADGTMLGMISGATLCAAQFLQRSLPFDPARDFRAVSFITDSAVLLAVHAPTAATRGWRDLADFLAWARLNPGAARIAHAGPGTVSHLALSALATTARVELTQVPYRGGAQAALDAVAGTIEGSADLPTALVPPVETGRLAALGVSSGRRLDLLPGVPAFAETPGLGALDIRSWNALVLPAATPDAEARRLHAAVRQVVALPVFREAMRPLGYDAVSSESPAAADAQIAAERPRWQRLVEASGARLD